ncbi:DJ-1/PfpI family protein [Curvibacter sp. APW13]|uniref:DJ-1/PfpI family protein n=1 Tax=Curvibacter sp. APW13 TaxID=3077236 RepID=UPI0028E04B0F|nr:DJ-1/PfpI family protein [Curvibacter sp. APW13]MDT8992284.1 DJ-1/PfpI family protein [Curvibacter sp. APW13]
MTIRTSIAALACVLLAALVLPARSGPTPPGTHQTYEEFVQAVRPARGTAVVAILAHSAGTETTDFLVPHALLRRAGVEVVAVAPVAGAIPLMPALQVQVDTDFAAFDKRYPSGADYVIVPALHRSDDPQVLAWLQAQQQRGATIIAVCAGAQVLAAAGLLDGRGFTGHWWDRKALARAPGARHVPNQRYLADAGVVTTTGVSASMPATLALIEAIQGAPRAAQLANELGLPHWGIEHDSGRFSLDASAAWTTVGNTLAFWRHETVGLPVHDGVDDVALALLADAWSRSYRSQAIALAPRPVRLASGLTLLPAESAQATWTLPVANEPAACQLDRTLDAMAHRYGAATSRWVATQLEHIPTTPATAACTPLASSQSLSLQ